MFSRTFDPDNRLVADTLEADWNEHLRRLDGLQQEHDQRRAADKVLLNDEARARILALARDFPRVWNNSRTAPLERKRMLALLIEDATLLKESDIAIQVRFRGGQTVSLSIPRSMPMAEVARRAPRWSKNSMNSCNAARIVRRHNSSMHLVLQIGKAILSRRSG
jgi:hypothetical protein